MGRRLRGMRTRCALPCKAGGCRPLHLCRDSTAALEGPTEPSHKVTHCTVPCRLQSHPGTWNEVQTSFSRKEVARALDSYRLNVIIVQVRQNL